MTDDPKLVQFDRWEQCEEALRSFDEFDRAGRSVWFRGQSHSNWPLLTTPERRTGRFSGIEDYFRLIRVILPQISTYTNKSWTLPHPQETFERSSKYDDIKELLISAYGYLAHLRHHGFPSPNG